MTFKIDNKSTLGSRDVLILISRDQPNPRKLPLKSIWNLGYDVTCRRENCTRFSWTVQNPLYFREIVDFDRCVRRVLISWCERKRGEAMGLIASKHPPCPPASLCPREFCTLHSFARIKRPRWWHAVLIGDHLRLGSFAVQFEVHLRSEILCGAVEVSKANIFSCKEKYNAKLDFSDGWQRNFCEQVWISSRAETRQIILFLKYSFLSLLNRPGSSIDNPLYATADQQKPVKPRASSSSSKTSSSVNEPLDSTVPYTIPQKKRKPKKSLEEPRELTKSGESSANWTRDGVAEWKIN